MSDWLSKPRVTPMAGRRKPTSTWCPACECLHRTRRHAQGEEACPAMEASRAARREALFAGPAAIQPPRPQGKRVQLGTAPGALA